MERRASSPVRRNMSSRADTPNAPLNLAILGVGNRTRQLFQPAPSKDFLKLIQQRFVNQRVRPQRFTAGNFERTTVKVRDFTASLFHHQHSGSRIPRIEIELPKAVIAARGNVTKIKRSRARAPNSVRS